MSTAALIALQTSNGYAAATVNWDGDTVGEILNENYTRTSDITKLINLGEIRSLGEDIESTETFSDSQGMISCKDFGELMEVAQNMSVDYTYVHTGVEDGEWMTVTNKVTF